MDPVSGPASILTVLGAALGGCKIVYNIVIDLKDAPNDIQLQNRKLQNLQNIIHCLLETCKNLPQEFPFSSHLHGIDEFVQDVSLIRIRIETRAQSSASGTASRVRESFGWLLFDRQLKKFFSNLEHYNMIFSHALWIVQLSMLNRIVQQTAPKEKSCCELEPEYRQLPEKCASNLTYMPTHSRESTVPSSTSPKIKRMLDHFSHIVDPVGITMRNGRKSRLGAGLHVNYQCGSALNRRWSSRGQRFYNTAGNGLLLSFEITYIVYVRMVISLFFLPGICPTSKLNIRCSMKTSTLVPWGHTDIRAVQMGDIDCVRQRISCGKLDINCTAPGGRTLLHIAASHEQADIISLLLENGADVDVANDQGETPLHISVKAGRDIECARRLLAGGADLCQPGANGRSALHTMYNPVSAYIFQHYVDDIDFWAQDKSCMTLLHYLSWTNRCSLEQFLRCASNAVNIPTYRSSDKAMSPISFKDGQGKSVLHYATQRGNLDLIHSLLQRPDVASLSMPDHNGRTLLHYATESSRTQAIDLFLSRGMGVDTLDHQGWSILHHACWRGNDIAVRHLVGTLGLVHQLDIIDHDCQTPLDVAKRFRCRRIFEYLNEIRPGKTLDEKQELASTATYTYPNAMPEMWLKRRGLSANLMKMYPFILHALLVMFLLIFLHRKISYEQDC